MLLNFNVEAVTINVVKYTTKFKTKKPNEGIFPDEIFKEAIFKKSFYLKNW
ncbi:hypothetical protein IJG14_05095 [bacterium]|nr:hypothetical protein [bacterium]